MKERKGKSETLMEERKEVKIQTDRVVIGTIVDKMDGMSGRRETGKKEWRNERKSEMERGKESDRRL